MVRSKKYNRYNFTREEIESAASRAKSRAEMIRILKIRSGGSAYDTLADWCKRFDVTPPDGSALGHSNIKKHSFIAMSDEEWFVDNIRRNGPATRKRLVKSGVADECVECGLTPIWNGKVITLQVDHVDGNRWNNKIENVRIMCPNCHSQTETYSNNGSRRARNYCGCGAEIGHGSTWCKPCSTHNATSRNTNMYIVEYPPIDELIEMLKKLNYVQVGKQLGCSDNAVRKHVKRQGYDPKTLIKH